ncbi:hypothetical protein IID24_03010 [Patescibacteria group bacterium]|nr:hypothetical protein [Patescibacteria group bacterium]
METWDMGDTEGEEDEYLAFKTADFDGETFVLLRDVVSFLELILSDEELDRDAMLHIIGQMKGKCEGDLGENTS